jgi:site-specific DNA recombinase
MKNAVGYIRVSTDGQVGEDRFGIDSQKEQILEHADRNGYKIMNWFIDEGVSGIEENRPALDTILYGEVSNPPVEYVIVAKSDRIARDIKLYFYYKQLLYQKNIKLVSVTEDFGEFGAFAGILEAFTMFVAEQERQNITKRTSGGRHIKAAKGGYSGGQAPYGYKVSDRRLVIVPEEAEAVRDMFTMSANGSTLQEIADEMNKRGLITHRGGMFRTSTIQTILNNRKTYEGWYKYGKNGKWVKGQHSAILPWKEYVI